MDNLWLLLLIIGAVISLSQKSQKQRPQQEQEDDEQARDVLQKQLEEIFGRREETPDVPHPAPTPIPTPTPQRKAATRHPDTVTAPAGGMAALTTQRSAVRPQTQPAAASAARDTSHRNTAMAQAGAKRQPQNRVAAATQHDGNDIGRMIEEFDMERAVIYAEILKPKYEEY